MRLLTLFAALLSTSTAFAQSPAKGCERARDLHLVNGKISTLDAKNSTVTEVTIQNGVFTAVGKASGLRVSPCTRTIDLKGRAVVPGLVDNHNHILLLGLRPG